MNRSPLLLRILGRVRAGAASEYIIGDIAEEYARLRAEGRWWVQWWLLRQTVGVLLRSRRMDIIETGEVPTHHN